MHSVQEVLKKNNILDDAYHVTFTTELAFECMVAYVAYFHVRFSGYDETGLIELSQIGVLLNQVYKVKQQDTDPIWQLWLQAVDHAINDSYPLDAFWSLIILKNHDQIARSLRYCAWKFVSTNAVK